MQTIVKLKDIVETMKADGSFGIFVKCIRATDLVKFLADTGRVFTVFAPNDAAFHKLIPYDNLRTLLDDKPRLTRVVRYHILPRRRIPHNHIDGRDVLRTLDGTNLLITTDTGFTVNGVAVIRPDIEAVNGIIHEIGSVLSLPDTAGPLI